MDFNTSAGILKRPIRQQELFGRLWLEESVRFEFDMNDLETAQCAELADELAWYGVMAADDPDFDQQWWDWMLPLYENDALLPLEQSCYEGVLLPSDQRALRLESCPESALKPLRWFFEMCPVHVKHRIALDIYLMVRMDRARRTGSPEWTPKTAQPEPEERAFFTAPVLKFRNYAR